MLVGTREKAGSAWKQLNRYQWFKLITTSKKEIEKKEKTIRVPIILLNFKLIVCIPQIFVCVFIYSGGLDI
jgi:hypothetical protein